ncbi:putative peptidase M20 family protein [Sphingobium sp. SYK-6]|uniref:M20/M25/M40 family metallo-hydrolase n=1 Tax=Sphingobium sp. (strain NBRC 103272 / SYK-6) TaxID=627192 RepID=UPI00022778F9|nr:M20/M25/M40 family metallo-hydrolase [Sphingobium sp. SYK-6]BAK68048.1 putative peptidase M20 family protein [Sphingobium sp. SYK-6]
MADYDRRTILAGSAAMAGLATATAPAIAAGRDDKAVRDAIAKNHDAAVQRLKDWIALPSIAAEGRNMPEGAAHMEGLLREAGFQTVKQVPTSGYPVVFGTLDAGAKKTMGIYFMYDVKQYDPAEWSSPPLEGKIVDRAGLGKVMMGRGAVNQKGPQATFLAALHAMKAAGRKLPVNLVLVAEGEEEIASPHFPEAVAQPDVLAALRKCVGVIIPTGWQSPSDGGVAINLGAKGALELELVVTGEKWGKGPKGDIHSSQKARVDSPAWRLVAALQTLVTPDGNMPAIDGYMDKVRPLTPRQLALIAENARASSEEETKRLLGVSQWIDGMTWEESLVRLAAVPTVNIEGLVSGYTGPGGKTILPGRAVAKLDLRLVPDMTKEDSLAKLRAHLDRRGFDDVEIVVGGGYGPTETDENSALIRAQRATYTRFDVPTTLYPRLAGSWPGVVFTGAPVSLPAGQFGLGHGSGAHAPDEYFLIESSNPKVAGMDEAALGFVDFLYQIAAIG